MAAALAAAAGLALLPPSALYFAEYAWAPSPLGTGAMCASAPGAQLRAAFSGSASVALVVDATATAAQAAASPLVAWSVDLAMWRSAWAAAPNNGSVQLLPLAAGLDAAAGHAVRVVLDASSQSGDRWLFSATDNQFLCVLGLAVDAGGAALAPALRPRRGLVFGDSITEGATALRMVFGPGTGPGAGGGGWGCDSGGNGAYASSNLNAWAHHVSEALDAEFSLSAFAAQGYATRNSYNYGNVPPLITPGDDAASAWDKVFANASRLPALAARPPDFIFNAEGWNDQVVPATQLTPVVTASLAALRAATGPRTVIFQVLPFGGLMCDANATRAALMEGFAAYKASAGGAADDCALLLDTYPLAIEGITGNCKGNIETTSSCEGTHPNVWAHARIAAIVTMRATQLLSSVGDRCGFGR